MDKRKIYIVSWFGSCDAGGVERVTYYVEQAWKEKYDVEIIDFNLMKKIFIYRFLLEKHYVLDAILTSIYLNNMIHRHKHDDIKIVTQGYNAPYVKADILFSHGTMRGFKLATEGTNAVWHFNQIFERKAARNARKVIAVDNHVKKELHELYEVEKRKIIVLENCVDTDLFVPKQKQKEQDVRKILFVGRLEHGKGLSNLLELAKHIENRSDLKLVIAANNDTNAELFDEYKNVEIKVGIRRERMNDFYNEGDIMFFPSLYEGFGLVTIEALSAGIPVMGNNVGVVSDLYKRGQRGVAIIQKNMQKNIDKVIEMAEEYRDYQKRLQLHNEMVKTYNMKNYIKKLEDLWD